MSEYEQLIYLVRQRLTAATEDICGLFYVKVSEYEEELRRHRQLLDALIKSQVRLHRTDIQQLLASNEVEERSPSLDQVDPPRLLHVKEEQEELRISQETEQRQSHEEGDTTMETFSPVTPVSMMTDDREKPESSELQQSPTEENRDDEVDPPKLLHFKEEQEKLGISQETEQCQSHEEGDTTMDTFSPVSLMTDDGEKPESSELQQSPTEENRDDEEECAGRETVRDSDNHSVVDTEDSSDFSDENDDSDDCTKSSKPRKSFSCSECGKRFSQNGKLKTHMKIHSGQKSKVQLTHHKESHSKAKKYSCNVCNQRFTRCSELNTHKRAGCQSSQLHQSRTEEKRHGGSEPVHDENEVSQSPHCNQSGLNPLQNNDIPSSSVKYNSVKPSVSSSECPTFSGKIQTRVKQFSCSVCGRRYHQKSALKVHMRIHMQGKWFVCTDCYEPFQSRADLEMHKKSHT